MNNMDDNWFIVIGFLLCAIVILLLHEVVK